MGGGCGPPREDHDQHLELAQQKDSQPGTVSGCTLEAPPPQLEHAGLSLRDLPAIWADGAGCLSLPDPGLPPPLDLGFELGPGPLHTHLHGAEGHLLQAQRDQLPTMLNSAAVLFSCL